MRASRKPEKRGFVQNSKGCFWGSGILMATLIIEAIYYKVAGKTSTWILIVGLAAFYLVPFTTISQITALGDKWTPRDVSRSSQSNIFGLFGKLLVA